MDELFRNTAVCFSRYQTAQIILHSLSARANEKDKAILTKCNFFLYKCFKTNNYNIFISQIKKLLSGDFLSYKMPAIFIPPKRMISHS